MRKRELHAQMILFPRMMKPPNMLLKGLKPNNDVKREATFLLFLLTATNICLKQRMEKRFKLRISRFIPSFHSCGAKDLSTLPEDPVPSILHLETLSKRHLSTALVSLRRQHPQPPEFKWQRDENWHVVTKLHDDTPRRKVYISPATTAEELFLPQPPPKAEKKKKKKKKKRRNKKKKIATSSSAAQRQLSSAKEGQGERGEEDTGILAPASRGFSTGETQLDSTKSSTNHTRSFPKDLESTCATPISRRPGKKATKRAKESNGSPAMLLENELPARLSVFKKLIPCGVEGKVKESLAMAKKSEDPYRDFKRSMMEMVLEKQMFEKKEMEQLLQCFLSLNSLQYHGVIVEVFAEIWDTLFCRGFSLQQISTSLGRSSNVIS